MKLSHPDREKIWSLGALINFNVDAIKGIAQNPVEIDDENVQFTINEIDQAISRLKTIRDIVKDGAL